MFLEMAATIPMAALGGYSYLKSKGNPASDAEKIRRIFVNAGLTINEEGKKRTIRLYRKTKFKGGTEYVYQLPYGMSTDKIISHQSMIEDGLNIQQSEVSITLQDLKTLKFNKTILKQIKALFKNKKTRKEIDISFDGMLRIKVYDEPLADQIPWSDTYLKKQWKVVVGESRSGAVYHDFSKLPHIIVAGTSGFGKSQFLKMLITSLVLQNKDNVSFSLIDLKEGASFLRFKDLKQVKHYGDNPQAGFEVLQRAQEDMEKRLKETVKAGYEDIEEAGINERHFIVIDEAADLDDKALEIVTDIARRGRGPGFHLVFATQYPTNETLPSQVRQNISARVCFVLKTATASMAVLDETGAEDLPLIPGRGIYQRVHKTIVQTPYMSNPTIKERIEPHINIRGKEDESESPKKTPTDGEYTIEFK